MSSVERDERVERLANEVVQMIADLPRFSPEDQPDMMLVTADELRDFIREAWARSQGAVPSPDGLTVEQTQILREVGKDVDAVFGNNDGTVWDCPECGTNVTGPAVAMPCPKCGVQMVRRGSPDGGDLPAPRRGSPEWLTGEVGDLQRYYYGTPPGDWATAWDLFKRAMRLLLGAPPAPRGGTVPGAGAIPAALKIAQRIDDALLGATPPRNAAESDLTHLLEGAADTLRQLAALSAGPPPDAPRWREFFGNVWNAVREGYSLDGGELQDWAEETGLLVRVQRIAPCGEGCVCAEFDADGPTDCYMPFDSPELAALRASPPLPTEK